MSDEALAIHRAKASEASKKYYAKNKEKINTKKTLKRLENLEEARLRERLYAAKRAKRKRLCLQVTDEMLDRIALRDPEIYAMRSRELLS